MINFDYLTLRAFVEENIDFLIDSRLQKIQQPTRRDFILSFRNRQGGRKMYVNINPSFFHVCFLNDETVNLYYKWKEATDAIADAKELIHSESDPEMKEFLKAEMEENEAKIAKYEEDMKILLLPRDPMDDKDIMLEIRGGAGGDEANIFAGDLMRMYIRYADKQGWQTQIGRAHV